jgi:hypothetical protein
MSSTTVSNIDDAPPPPPPAVAVDAYATVWSCCRCPDKATARTSPPPPTNQIPPPQPTNQIPQPHHTGINLVGTCLVSASLQTVCSSLQPQREVGLHFHAIQAHEPSVFRLRCTHRCHPSQKHNLSLGSTRPGCAVVPRSFQASATCFFFRDGLLASHPLPCCQCRVPLCSTSQTGKNCRRCRPASCFESSRSRNAVSCIKDDRPCRRNKLVLLLPNEGR